MNLQAQSQLPVGVAHPFADFRRQRRAIPFEDRRDEDGQPCVEVVRANERDRPIEVATVGHDELHLVARPQLREVREIVRGCHPRAGALHVEDLHDARVDAIDGDVAARLDEDGKAPVAEFRRERVEALLFERLSAGDFDEGRAEDGGLSRAPSRSKGRSRREKA